MAPKGAQKIEIEKTHGDPLPSLNQAVTENYPDFLGTALVYVFRHAPDKTVGAAQCCAAAEH
jgi:hypothetical protein